MELLINSFSNFKFKFKCNKTIILLTKDSITTLDRNFLISFNVLKVVNDIYDALALISPITIRLRIAFRNIFTINKNLDWDDPLAAGS